MFKRRRKAAVKSAETIEVVNGAAPYCFALIILSLRTKSPALKHLPLESPRVNNAPLTPL